ncbi:MAG: TetR/AcrR family transcriptional regulator [Oscillospiraceae bacterium]|jgi:AcrR family transcriptional regulator|nr:TetR/AcrR family transcriptional regulator [Oscillospiraceae bacterium]
MDTTVIQKHPRPGRPPKVGNSGLHPTKERILNAALRLFSEEGFSRTSIRDIAKESGYTHGLFYNHFSSKEEVLRFIYNYYREEVAKVMPDLDTLLAKCETQPPLSVLAQTDYYFPAEIQETMDRIIVIAVMESRVNDEARAFINECLLDLPQRNLAPLLHRLVELKKIEPLDIDVFCMLTANYLYAAAIRNHSLIAVSMEDWLRGRNALFTAFVKPI